MDQAKKGREQAKRGNQFLRAIVIPLDRQAGYDQQLAKGYAEDAGDVSIHKGDAASRTRELPDPWAEFRPIVGKLIEPPLDLLSLASVPEVSPILGPCIAAMAVNVAGFGWRLQPRAKAGENDAAFARELATERLAVDNFLTGCCYVDGYSFTRMRKEGRQDLESTGNWYTEVLRDASGKVDGLHHLPAHQMRLTTEEKEFVEVTLNRVVGKPDGKFEIVQQRAFKRFRRIVQYRGGIYRYFKELGDPRIIHADTGEVVTEEQARNWQDSGNPLPEVDRASEVLHQKIYCARSAYGLPRWVGALLAVTGTRRAEEINFATFNNNQIPSLALLVSNGQVTEGTLTRIEEFVEDVIQGNDSRSRMLVIEAEGALEGPDPGNVKLDLKPLNEAQISEALFGEYMATNETRTRRTFRLPPLYLGDIEDYNRATADRSHRLTDEQVFDPDRRDEDETWNQRLLVEQLGIVYHEIRTNTPNITNDEDLIKLIKEAEKAGAMTPDLARALVEDILGRDLDLYPLAESVPGDVPFSLTMAEAVKNQAKPNEVSQQVTALKALGIEIPDALDGVAVVDGLLALRERFGDEIARRVAKGVTGIDLPPAEAEGAEPAED